MSVKLSTRRATIDDREAILSISERIWEGKDYVPRVLESWLLDRSGELIVGTEKRMVLGFYHLAYRGGQAWMEGLRVDEGHRRRGVATELSKDALERVRGNGKRVIRLVADEENAASRRIFEGLGFDYVLFPRQRLKGELRQAERYLNWRLPTRDEILNYLAEHGLMGEICRLLPDSARWWELDAGLVDEFLTRGSAIASARNEEVDGLILYTPGKRHGAGNYVQIVLIDGSEEAMRGLINRLAQISTPDDFSGYFSTLPKDSRGDGVLNASGFTKGQEFVIMGKSI